MRHCTSPLTNVTQSSQSELEAEIAKEQKQAARLEWLLNRVSVQGAWGRKCVQQRRVVNDPSN